MAHPAQECAVKGNLNATDFALGRAVGTRPLERRNQAAVLLLVHELDPAGPLSTNLAIATQEQAR